MDGDRRYDGVVRRPPRPHPGGGLRGWARSYLLAGRIAAGIFQATPDERLSEPSAFTRLHAVEDGSFNAMERAGNVILTMPLESSVHDVAPTDRKTNGSEAENPLDLPRLGQHA
ncbi:MAG TPA: hypothetical protein VGR16_14985 [Thermomicrobiales bacterium]|nr:hypothetical protein [Thermomicrobiales bacterium]